MLEFYGQSFLSGAGSKFKQNKALMPQPDVMLDIPEDEELKDVAPVIAKPPKVTLSRDRVTVDPASMSVRWDIG